MNKKNIIIYLIILTVIITMGMFFYSKQNNSSSSDNSKLIYDKTISPNEEYVDYENDRVFYTIKVYQNSNKKIIVKSSSNSTFAKDIQYELDYNKTITQSDVNVEWTTFVGDKNYTKEDQIAVAVVSIYSDNKIISQRRINFVTKVIEIVVETINNK